MRITEILRSKLKTTLSPVAGKVNAKQVCEALLGGLCFQHVEYWVQALSLIEQLLPQVDYKGVRDLLKLLFDKVSRPEDGDVCRTH